MSRGIGKAQRAMLDALAAADDMWALTVKELAERVGVSERQVLRGVRSLEARGLVVVTREHLGWKGAGEYGRLVPRGYEHKEEPTVLTVKAGESWPFGVGYVARRDVEFVRNGMPTPGLLVWLPDRRDAYVERRRQQANQIRAALGANR